MTGLERPRFIINTGKGGVGKSTVSLAMALALSERGRRVLHMQLNANDRVGPALGVPRIGPEIAEVAPRLWCVNTTPRESLREYALMILRIKALYRAVFENRVIDKLLRVMPGLPELTMLGKAYFHEKERLDDGRPRFDTIIIDAPATGHGMFLLQIPTVIRRAVATGHMAEEANAMMALLADPERTIVNLVTLAEEMPVNETLEMHATLRSELDVRVGYVIANAILPERFEDDDVRLLEEAARAIGDAGVQGAVRGGSAPEATLDERQARLAELSPIVAAGGFQARRRAMQVRYVDELRRSLPEPLITLPHALTATLGTDEHRMLGESLLRAADRLDEGRRA